MGTLTMCVAYFLSKCLSSQSQSSPKEKCRELCPFRGTSSKFPTFGNFEGTLGTLGTLTYE